MNQTNDYHIKILWTGNQGQGTKTYRSYERSYSIVIDGKPDIAGSSDPQYRGDRTKHNPEEMFLASISACHMLWYLHLCADHGISVLHYSDEVRGHLKFNNEGKGQFNEVVLHPKVTISDSEMESKALYLHQMANQFCFIANSCNFNIRHKPTIRFENTEEM